MTFKTQLVSSAIIFSFNFSNFIISSFYSSLLFLRDAIYSRIIPKDMNNKLLSKSNNFLWEHLHQQFLMPSNSSLPAFEYVLIFSIILWVFATSLLSSFYENRLKSEIWVSVQFHTGLREFPAPESLRSAFYCRLSHLRLFAAIIFLEIILLILFCHKRKDFVIYAI